MQYCLGTLKVEFVVVVLVKVYVFLVMRSDLALANKVLKPPFCNLAKVMAASKVLGLSI